MSSIRILSDRVANQIAAGEVIERPVAVVKELVENSIDAGATRIEVEFRNGGKSYIRVEDNGSGMGPDETLLALERHATSKIRESRDLVEVRSFGFRGEALPSIASVSRFTLRTRPKDATHGTEIRFNGGKLLDKKECGMPPGTVIEVAHLFNSVPARRKFLKTNATETAHITYTCRLFAVAHPGVAFHVLENGRTVFQSPACEHLSDRIAEIWGRNFARDLIPVEASDPGAGYRLTGLTAKPGIGRSTRRELVTLVNRRPVDSRTLGFAVLDAYHGQIQKGRYPPAFLFLELAAREVDVNVHPAKREIRFHNDGAVRRFVLNAVTDTLAAYRTQDLPTTETPSGRPESAGPRPAQKPEFADPNTNTESESDQAPARTASPASGSIAPEAMPPPASLKASGSPETSASAPVEPQQQPGRKDEVKADDNTEGAERSDTDWRFVALLKKRYALFNTPDGLVMLHLRNAHQRVRYEKIKREFEKENSASQNLLIPQPIEFEPLASETLKAQTHRLKEHGFSIEPFGRHFYRIEAVPAWLSPEQAEPFLRDLVDLCRQRGDSRDAPGISHDAVARLAVQGSYRRNDPLTATAAEQLARDLLSCETPHTSPFGKPTFSEISWKEWERRFGES
ncbi:MAG: DNA mismatch repair endonuclease MutL [Opitutales bacterium]